MSDVSALESVITIFRPNFPSDTLYQELPVKKDSVGRQKWCAERKSEELMRDLMAIFTKLV